MAKKRTRFGSRGEAQAFANSVNRRIPEMNSKGKRLAEQEAYRRTDPVTGEVSYFTRAKKGQASSATHKPYLRRG
ncbi:hypothetical protein [Alicyclobacillus sp. SO9]|uniref:hypothetical protein n=1 Tax=Alicyclobacillus sp. SO9 TaxID=2665646 RepID=UPI0018E80226|nr:hypothetical protein [Alicyclobacillus sp. SO9]QQE80442.1 hypothetical protein GI364_08520 [Alicyclobacillus sp. SO9]